MSFEGPDDVRVFLAAADLARQQPHLERALSEEDRAHIARFKFDADREVACASRVLQRLALSACAPCAPTSWQFAPEPLGKPRISGPADAPALAFSVANTRGLVACAVTSGQPVGIDVEPLRAEVPMSVARRCWSPAELEAFERLPRDLRARRFADIWTAKEAYAKARGQGLALDFRRVAVQTTSAGYRYQFDPKFDDDDGNWELLVWTPTVLHVLALGVRTGGKRCHVRHEWIGSSPAEAR